MPEKIVLAVLFGAALAYLAVRIVRAVKRAKKKEKCGPDCNCE